LLYGCPGLTFVSILEGDFLCNEKQLEYEDSHCRCTVLNSQHVVDDRIDEEGSKKIFECYHFVMFYVI